MDKYLMNKINLISQKDVVHVYWVWMKGCEDYDERKNSPILFYLFLSLLNYWFYFDNFFLLYKKKIPMKFIAQSYFEIFLSLRNFF